LGYDVDNRHGGLFLKSLMCLLLLYLSVRGLFFYHV
jgi:hypothetical protein